ncbi:sensor histidine kinase [Flavobacterium noncentrifugens]|uniref:Tetratricopeptide repeat-containing protein n=1 Tax=Flavobacterium noncentrifugens TaxID=1128970 RepID=A0A1G8ZHM5_9FLAO|nr:histidine kinase [Flavobacterium noncentrifugens]GEP51928.1 sensor histidine kinase [Flavobacterium noncentrifugens]SDK14538.1 Tetratricopeptide repeat-containing protein [Flavobacterium noncentrifugens]
MTENYFTKYVHTAIALLLLVPIAAFSQDKTLDSLVAIMNSKAPDTIILQTFEYMYDNAYIPEDQKKNYEDKVNAIIRKNLSKGGLTEQQRDYFESFDAIKYVDQFSILFDNDPGKAVLFADKAIAIYRKTKRHSQLASMLVTKGICHNRFDDQKTAISCFYEALRISEKHKDADGIVYASNAIASTYNEQLNFKAAIPYYKKGIAFYESKKTLSPSNQVQYSSLCYNLGNAYQYIDELGLALKYLTKGYDISIKSADKQIAGPILRLLGTVNFKLKKYDASLSFYERSLELTQNDYMKAYTLSFMAGTYVAKKEFGKAIVAAEQAIKDGANGPKSFTILTNAYLNLHEAYRQSGQFENALSAYKKGIAYQDSIGREQSKKELRDQSQQYAFEKKALLSKMAQDQKMQQEIGRRDRIIYGSVFVVLVLLIGILFLYYRNKQRHLIHTGKNNELKQKLLLTQMTPHFIFNSVTNIQGLIQSKKDTEAVRYLGKFSKLTRQILENSRENFVVLSEELSMLENYLTIQKLLHNDKFSYEIIVDESIDAARLLVPPMLTQPFIENAIKHGLKNKSDGGRISIRYYWKENRLYFEVTDNGSGLLQQTANVHQSLSTQITQERLDSIADKSGIVIHTTNQINLENAITGVKTHFEIPYQLNS